MSPVRQRLLTPGPLTTSAEVKAAMLTDYGSRDVRFTRLTASIRSRLVGIAGRAGTHTAVPLQGSGTFVVEAMFGTFLPRTGRLLVLVNGAYGQRIVQLVERMGRSVTAVQFAETEPISVAALEAALAADPSVTHVAAVHCETTTGLLNPIADIGRAVAAAGRGFLIDAMSAFGVLEIPTDVPYEALAASSNKCLEGVPGVGFCIADMAILALRKGNAHSVSLDLEAQWAGLEKTGQWRFTPPTHVLLALGRALDELEAEGGPPARLARYRANCHELVSGLRALGLETLLPDSLQAPIIVTIVSPSHPRFAFGPFYDRLGERGFVIYPGKLTESETFRMGCIGQLFPADLRDAVAAVSEVLREMEVLT